MTILDYHRLRDEEIAARDLVKLEATVRSERDGFPERVESLLPPLGERHLKRDGWPYYERLRELCDLYLHGKPAQREWIRSKIDWDRSYQLGLFRMQARETAVVDRSAELFRLAMVSLAISDLACRDSRDVIMSLYPMLKTARDLGANWGEMVQETADMSGPGMSALFLDFLRNHPN